MYFQKLYKSIPVGNKKHKKPTSHSIGAPSLYWPLPMWPMPWAGPEFILLAYWQLFLHWKKLSCHIFIDSMINQNHLPSDWTD